MVSPQLHDALPDPVRLDDIGLSRTIEQAAHRNRFIALYRQYRPLTRAQAMAAVELLFKQTSDLRIRSNVKSGPALTALRHTTPIHLSTDTVRSLTGGTGKQDVLDALELLFEPDPYPWLLTGRVPTRGERKTAVALIAQSYAVNLFNTQLRTEYSRLQEGVVFASLIGGGFTQVTLPGKVVQPDALKVGEFCVRSRIELSGGNVEADCLVRTNTDRWLVVEAKYSGSDLNGTKRLARECGDKKSKLERAGRFDFLVVLGGCFSEGDLRAFVHNGGRVVFDHMLPLVQLAASPVAALPDMFSACAA